MERNMGGWAIAVHGGAGVDPNLPQQRQEEAKQLLNRCLNLGIDALRSNLSAVDVVELVGVEVVDNEYFITEENVGMLKLAKEANTIMFDYSVPEAVGLETCSAVVESPILMNGLPISVYAPETVGCVVVDSQGRCAAATSTGGLMNKMSGRIGDSPLIGAGTYASNLCGVSCTGEGEAIIRGTLAREVAAVMEYKGLGLQEAVDFVIKERLDEGKAGLIAVSNKGEVAWGFNTTGMFRGCATEDGFMEVGIWD
ncbi:hypothetical protein I3760_15G050000 [Carya illinoinensis]|nr:hypothetical protein I3760_15G050000 [Carya illinoinensis]